MALVLGTNCGFVTSAPSSNPSESYWGFGDYVYCMRVQAPANGTVTSMGFYLPDASPITYTVDLGIYDDNSGEPGNLIEKGTDSGVTQADVNTWVVIDGFSTEITSGTYYWIAFGGSSNGMSLSYKALGLQNRREDTNGGLLESSWDTVNDTTSTNSVGVYALYEESAAGTNMQVNIGDTWKEITGAQVNIGDTWKEVAGAQVNIGDSWKEVF